LQPSHRAGRPDPFFGLPGGIRHLSSEGSFRKLRLRPYCEADIRSFPGNVRNRRPLRGRDRGFHSAVQALGQSIPGLGRTVIVFAGGDITSAASEVNMRNPFLLLQARASDPGNIRTNLAVTIVTHGVGCVVSKRTRGLSELNRVMVRSQGSIVPSGAAT